MKGTKIKNGLRPLVEDSRDLKVGAFLDLPKLKDIPDKLILGEPSVVNQYDTDFCGAAATSALSELHEGIPLSFEWLFAVAKMIEGDKDSWGLDLRTACKAAVKYGSIKRTEAPYSLDDKPDSFLRDINNWDKDLFLAALEHRKKTYVRLSSSYSPFDTIRAFMYYYHLRGEKNGALIGLEWNYPLRELYIEPSDAGGSGFGHAVAAIGFEGDYLYIQNSAGKEAGDKGHHWVHKDIINRDVGRYGAYTLLDIPRDHIEYHVQIGSKVTDNWLDLIISAIKRIFK